MLTNSMRIRIGVITNSPAVSVSLYFHIRRLIEEARRAHRRREDDDAQRPCRLPARLPFEDLVAFAVLHRDLSLPRVYTDENWRRLPCRLIPDPKRLPFLLVGSFLPLAKARLDGFALVPFLQLEHHGAARHPPDVLVFEADDVDGRGHARAQLPFVGLGVFTVFHFDDGVIVDRPLDGAGQRPDSRDGPLEFALVVVVISDL